MSKEDIEQFAIKYDVLRQMKGGWKGGEGRWGEGKEGKGGWEEGEEEWGKREEKWLEGKGRRKGGGGRDKSIKDMCSKIS